ncbi:MAG TPA: hypothetical protein VM328_13930 [Fimbriimonadaceae bacterium]|jgi:hypothetical protein|nr:hypothetical protein [Fimbriimonadaceae bacterium]
MDREIEIEGIPFETADEALQYVNASGRGVAITVEGINGYLVVERKVADILAERAVPFACFFDHEMPDGSIRVVSVPAGDH